MRISSGIFSDLPPAFAVAISSLLENLCKAALGRPLCSSFRGSSYSASRGTARAIMIGGGAVKAVIEIMGVVAPVSIAKERPSEAIVSGHEA